MQTQDIEDQSFVYTAIEGIALLSPDWLRKMLSLHTSSAC